MKHCKLHGLDYHKSRLIVAHIDGGMTITAHQKGRMIDGNDGGGGDGPFTPTRMGSLAVTDVLNLLYDRGKDEIRSLCSQTGGLSSHFGTSNSDKIHALVEQHDEKAELIWRAMIYQNAKAIGAMSAVLKGQVDGIVLTGGLLRFDMSKKPAWEVLDQLINHDWHTSVDNIYGATADVKGFYGTYELTAIANGKECKQTIHLKKGGKNDITITL
jgi:butyrate kinase